MTTLEKLEDLIYKGFKETDRKFRETDREIKNLSREVGKITDSLVDLLKIWLRLLF